MKFIKKPALACIILLSQVLGFSPLAQAALVDQLNGIIFDNDVPGSPGLDWLSPNLATTNQFGIGTGSGPNQIDLSQGGTMNKSTADAYINELNTRNYLGSNTWHLPKVPIINNAVDSCSPALFCAAGDLGHLWATHLGFTGTTTEITTAFGTQFTGVYWTDTGNVNDPTQKVFAYNFSLPPTNSNVLSFAGTYADIGPDGSALVWAVRDHVSPVPLPAAVWLFGSALLGLTGLSRKQRYSA